MGWSDGGVGNINSTPAVERVTVAADGRLYVWDQTGAQISGWPKDLSAGNRYFAYGPRLIDVDLDQELEIVAVSAKVGGGILIMHVFKGNGAELPAWQFALPHDAIVATPLIADVDHDSSLDIAYATPDGSVQVYRRDFSAAPNFAKSLAATPYLVAGDLDNNGLTDLFAVVGDTVVMWDEVGNVTDLVTLPPGEEIIGGATIIDIDRDFYPELVFTTTAHRIRGINHHGTVELDLAMPGGVQLIAPLLVEDVDVDHLPELLVLTARHEILAFETNGADVAAWSALLGYRQPAPVSGVVANDKYRGLFTAASGWDQADVYRTKSNAYGRIVLGEHVREWDTFAHFDFLEPIEVFDLFTFPKPFTPNGDGVNDTTTIHYRLSAPALVALDLYDAHERFLTRTQEKAPRVAGEHTEMWDGLNSQGTVTTKDDRALDTGLYLIKVVAQSPEGFVSQATVSTIVNGVKAEIETPTDDDETDAIYPPVFGVTTIMGIATDPNFGENNLDADFQSYKLYYRPGVWGMTPEDIVAVGHAGSAWLPLEVPIRHQCVKSTYLEPNDTPYPHSNVSCRPVQHGILGSFDASDLTKTPNGDYTLLLKVTDSNGNTVGKVNYDTVVVAIANPSPNSPYNPDDLFDKNNPKNPIYLGPKIVGPTLTNPLLTKANATTTISYALANETADIHLTIYHEGQGASSPVAAIYSFTAMAPNDPGNPQYHFVWNGTNTLGKPVNGGAYRVQIAAYAVDGTGVDINDSLTLTVAKGFAASDTLGVATDPATGASLFTATPTHFNPLGFGADLEPEKTYLDYALTKDAKVTIQVLEEIPGQGLVLRKTLSSGLVKKFDNGNEFWDGSGENGLILTVDRDYLIRLTAESIDIGNPATIQHDVVVHLDSGTLNGAITADLTTLAGDVGETATDDGALTALIGNPNFLWRAKGTGYVEMPFTYEIGASGTEQFKIADYGAQNSGPLYTCGVTGIIGPMDALCAANYTEEKKDACIVEFLNAHPQSNEYSVASVSVPEGYAITTYSVSAAGTNAQFEADNVSGSHDAFDLNAGGKKTFAVPPVLVDTRKVSFSGKSKPKMLGKTAGCVDTEIPCAPGGEEQFICDECPYKLKMDTLLSCGTFAVSATAAGPAGTRTWGPGAAFVVSGNHALISTGVNPHNNFASYTGAIGSGQADTVPGSAKITSYSLSISNTVNGIASSGSSNGNTITLPGLQAWLSGGSLSARVYKEKLLTDYFTDHDDTYLENAPYQKIWAAYTDFNDEFYQRDTRDVKIYEEGYQSLIANVSVGTTLYSFSDRVHLTAWDIDVRYPNITMSKPDGDNALDVGAGHRDVFHLEATTVTPASTSGTQNSNITDTFRLRLKPEAVARRFVEIHGSAAANYELYYYDNDAIAPQWRTIEPHWANPVANGLLAHWDVTGLNGEHYTVVLKSVSGDQVNIDTMDVAIGTLVDTSQLGPDEFVRVYSTFKKASLIFGAGALPGGPELITITPVKKDEADFALPSGIAPLGPIFDIKPDDIVIDPKYHVQLELVYTPAELDEAFGGAADPAALTIYNLTGPEAIEGLATIITFDNMDDDDPTNDVWRFTAVLEHFSEYFLAKKVAGYIHVEAPQSDAYLHGIVDISGRVETAPRPADAPDTPLPLASLTALTVSAYPEGNPAAKFAVGAGAADFAIPWEVSALNGNYRLRIEAQGPAGAASAVEIPVAIDNTPTHTTLLVNGVAVADGAAVTVGPGAIVELKATDQQTAPWQTGVQTIEYSLDGASFLTYEQPFNLFFVDGAHVVGYRGIDNNGNVESARSATLTVAEAMPADQAAEVNIQLTMNGPSFVAKEQTWVSPATTFALALAGDLPAQIKYRLGGSEFVPYISPITIAATAEGPYVLDYFAVDQMGLRSLVQSTPVLLDRSPPVTTITPQGLHVGDTLAVQGVPGTLTIAPATTLQLTAEDAGELPVGVGRIEYKLNDDPWQIYTVPLSFAATTTLAVRAIDRVGNVESAQTVTVRIDDTAPSFAVVDAPTVLSPNADGRNDTAQVVVNVADNLYATFALTMLLTDDAGKTYQPFTAVPLMPGTNTLTWDGRIDGTMLPEGVYATTLTVQDAGGNAAPMQTGTLTIDITPPQIQLIGGTVQAFSPNADSVQDILTVAYTLADNLFTTNLAVRLNIITLATEPILATEVFTGTSPAEQQLAWNGSNAAINAAFDGTYYFALIAEDPAGNRSTSQAGEAASSGEVLVDREPPATMFAVTGPTYDDDATTWLGPAAQIVLTATDPVVGAGVNAIDYGFDDAPVQTYVQPLALPQENVTYDFHYQAGDWVGNREILHTRTVRADMTAPVSTLTIGTPQETGPGDTTVVSPATLLTWEATDGNGVGVDTVWLELTGVKERAPYESAFTLTGLGDGSYTIRYWAEDFLGNEEMARTHMLTLDGTPPVTTLVIGDPHEVSADETVTYIRSTTPLTFTTMTERNELAATEYRIDEGAWFPAQPLTLPMEGAYTIAYRSTDRLQNVETARTQTIVVDDSPPTAILELSQTANAGGTDVTPLTQLTLSAATTGASVAGLEYQIDDGPWTPYTAPFTLVGQTAGTHVVRYRVHDQLGNISTPKELSAHLIDIDVTRAQSVVPRVLVFMLQTHDLHPTDPRPNSALIADVAEELGGYWTVIDGDQNDPATVDRFLAELRSDKYRTVIFATDAFVVKFFDTPKVVNLLNELKARIYKGDTFLSLVGYSEITDSAWTHFRAGFTARETASTRHFADVAPQLGIADRGYGHGRVVEFGGDVGRLADANATTRAILRTGLSTLIRDVQPSRDENNVHEVVDYTLTYRNLGDHLVTVQTTEDWPDGWIETKATGGEVAVTDRTFSLTIPPRGTAVIDYLYRAAAAPGDYAVTTAIGAAWEHGLHSAAALNEPYMVVAEIPALFDRVTGTTGLLARGDMPAVAEILRRARQRFLLAPDAGATAAEIDAVVALLLEAIDAIPVGTALTDAVHTAVAELIEVVGAHQAYGALTINLSVSRGDPNDPTSFHGDTASYLDGGEGGCSLVIRQ